MERIGIFGGSFDPPHIGHIQAAKAAVRALRLDRLLMMPAFQPPHKTLSANAPTPLQRLQMLRLACEEDALLQVSDLELSRGGISYTYETMEAVRQMYPEAELFLLMGSDMFLSFHNWKEPEKILANATVAVFYRGDRGEQGKVETQKAALEATGCKVHLIEHDVVDISSSQLRRLLAFGCIDAFLPQGVGDYIRANGLYNTAAAWKNLPEEDLERVVVGLLKPSRVAHVLGCRDAAVDLAKRWGADVCDAARAALLHDVTKALDGPLQLTLCDSYGRVLDDFSLRYPKTLHALTGSLVAQRIFGENEAVVAAIESHTTGKAAMNLLEKIIYVADYMEPNRDFPGVEELRQLAYSDMDAALERGIRMTLAHLARQGAEVSPASLAALEYLHAKV